MRNDGRRRDWGYAWGLVSGVGLGAIALALSTVDTSGARAQQPYKQVGTQEVVEARKFVLRDERGHVRLEIGPNAKGDAVGMRILDRKGKDRLSLAVGDDGEDVGVALIDGDNVLRVALSVQPDGQMVLVLGDHQAGLYAFNEGETAFIVDRGEGPRFMVGVDAAGDPVVEP